MKNKLLLSMLITFLWVPLSFAQDEDKSRERIHYKCYLMLSDQSKLVHHFVSVGKTQDEFEEGLPGSIVFSADGVTGSTVETVYQCVVAKAQFSNKEALELEKKTPF